MLKVMKPFQFLLRPFLALALVLTSLPAWICARPCGLRQDLTCVRLCAHSKALLTEGGKLASVGADTCAVRAELRQAPGVLGAVAALDVPVSHFVGLAPIAPSALSLLTEGPQAGRGPPTLSSYLSFQHPFTNGPPTLL